MIVSEQAALSDVVANDRAPAADVINLKNYRLARKIEEISRRQGDLAKRLRDGAADRERLAEALQGAQGRLRGIADSYRHLLARLDRERAFRDACRAALELDDLDEMIRRRDELASQLAALQRQPVRLVVTK